MDSTTYKYRGKLCDFDFYVFSIDTQHHCNTFEKLADHLTLNEAVEEYKRRNPYTPNDVLLVLGVNFLITAPEYRHDKVNIGAFDLLQRVNGEHRVPNDYRTDKALNDEKIISENAVRIIRILADELSGKPCHHGLTEIESKLLHEHLVTATDETALHGKTAEVAAEIHRHNEMEDSGEVPDDELSL